MFDEIGYTVTIFFNGILFGHLKSRQSNLPVAFQTDHDLMFTKWFTSGRGLLVPTISPSPPLNPFRNNFPFDSVRIFVYSSAKLEKFVLRKRIALNASRSPKQKKASLILIVNFTFHALAFSPYNVCKQWQQ